MPAAAIALALEGPVDIDRLRLIPCTFSDAILMPQSRTRRPTSLVFEKRNYALLAIGVALIAIGFALMRLENEFLGTISLYVAPLMIIAGYAEVIYAILWRSDESKEQIRKAREAQVRAEREAEEKKTKTDAKVSV